MIVVSSSDIQHLDAVSLSNVMTSNPSYYTNILCKYRVIIMGVATIFFVLVCFNKTYINSQSSDSNIFTIKDQERLVEEPKETATNLSHVMFVLVGGSRSWKDRRIYVESWWRPNVTRGNIFFDMEPSEEFQPWSRTLPPFIVSEGLKKLKIYPKLVNPVHTRIYRAILETYRLKKDKDVRWYVTGDDDTVFFVDNMVDVLSKYNHTEKHYIGMYSETTRANFNISFDMAFGGGGYALSYPLVEALALELDNCIERYYYIWAVDHLQSLCLADMGVDLTLEKGFHQMDLHGDISGYLSSHPTAPLVSFHHFGLLEPIFPGMDRAGSVVQIMKPSNVDQSRMLQQSICYVRESKWTFSVSWGYSVHIYENIFSRSRLKLPIETFGPWIYGERPLYMFNTRWVSRDPCEAPHWFFFDSIEQDQNGGVVTSYTRKFMRNMTSCSFSGNVSADPLASIRVFSPKTPKQGRKVECCDVEYGGADVANIRIRDCRGNEIIA